METISRNQARLQSLDCQLQHLDQKLVGFFMHERTLCELYNEEADQCARIVGNIYADHNRPSDAVSPLVAYSRSDAFKNAAALRSMIEIIRSRPEFEEAQRTVGPLLAQIEEAKAAVADDKLRLDDARCRLENVRRELEERALQAAAEDPEIARLQAAVEAAECVVAGAVKPDPAEMERQRKISETLKPIRRKGEALAIEALAGAD